jgi:hypothetical protein
VLRVKGAELKVIDRYWSPEEGLKRSLRGNRGDG